MTRSALALLVLLASPSLFAQSPQLSVTMSPSKTTVFSGEKLEVTITARNNGPVDAGYQGVSLSANQDQQLLTITAPAGWTCEEPRTDTASCTVDNFRAGSQAVFRATVHVSTTGEDYPIALTATVSIGGPDDVLDDNSVSREIQVVRHPSTAALSIHAEPQQSAVPPGQTATVTVNVHNAGPDPATNVVVRSWYSPVEAPNAQLQGAGWTCSGHTCTRPSLAAGQSAPLTFTFSDPVEKALLFRFTTGAELSFDPNGMDNWTEISIGIGDAAAWRRILLPLSFGETPGAFGSLWKTETTAVMDAGAEIEFQPKRFCIPRGTTCFDIPLRRPFDFAKAVDVRHERIPAQFVYVRTADEPKLALNLRVRDLTRTAETWGTEVPVVRENEWRTGAIVLAPLPVDPLFRLTLRVYDYHSITGNRVAVRIYADDETEPRATLTKTFQVAEGKLTTAVLPVAPGYIQLDPLAEAGDALAGAETMWIRVEPLSQGLKFWAFASVTNNPTGHVTTVTPQ